jgi:hypothetical protein
MKGLPAVKLASFELRRFLRARITAAALVVLAVIPLLYGALYLYAFWDPYGRLHHFRPRWSWTTGPRRRATARRSTPDGTSPTS